MPTIDDVDDMDRDVWCILGLPFDAINMNDAINKLHYSAKNEKSCFLSTPNLNFLIASQKDSSFKNSVINSALSVVDGKPIIWVAKLLNIPISERIAGSNLIEELIENKNRNKPLKVYFFGGEEGIAKIACEKLNENISGLECVGSFDPGFGSVESMSTERIINNINLSEADFVIVSLGAKKGQTWIEANKEKLNIPIISHLGAVVNFIAGTVTRAPKKLQKSGLEWLWRIKEEPALWKRYFLDAVSFFNLFVFKVIPLSILIRRNKKNRMDSNIHITNNNKLTVNVDGVFNEVNISKVNDIFKRLLKLSENVEICISKDSYVDAAFIAKILILKNKLSEKGRVLEVESKSKLVSKIFRYNCCDYLLR